ncbi:kinase-like domain-containing protein [Coemansia mojavensis]|nr:kinase-like domain-containing protein [Coemansia mojavensis]
MGRDHQSRILFVSLLENYCRTYDDDPLRNRRLFFAISRTLHSMGIIGKEYVDEMSSLRATYSDAFRQLVARSSGAWRRRGSRSGSTPNTFETMMMDVQRSRYHDDFVQLRCLGKGGFGKVYEVRNKLDGRPYAVKQIKIRGEITAEKTLREIKTLANLDHPNIVRYYSSWIEVTALRGQRQSMRGEQLYSMGDDDSIELSAGPAAPLVTETTLFVQMQLCQTTLQEFLLHRNQRIASRQQQQQQSMSPQSSSIVEAVKYFHNRGVIHRDLKGANVFLDIVYADSGGNPISRSASGVGRPGPHSREQQHYGPALSANSLEARTGYSETWTDTNDSSGMRSASTPSPPAASACDSDAACNRRSSVGCSERRTSNVGTITYAAPEQLRDEAVEYNEKADIYSLGIIFFELYYPFATAMERVVVIKDLRRGVFPPQFLQMWPKEAAFILQLMDANPERRPSAKEILSFDLIDIPTLESAQLKREVHVLKQQLRLANQRNEELGLRVRELERIVDLSI